MFSPPAPLIDASLAALMTGGPSISAASCNREGMPSAARALGCRLGQDLAEATILLARSQAEGLLGDVAAGGQLAVTFSEVNTHRTVQLKAHSARLEDAAPGDAALADRYCTAFCAILETMGFPPLAIQALLQWPCDDLVALRFTPSAAFVQTPGPQAGRSLRAGA